MLHADSSLFYSTDGFTRRFCVQAVTVVSSTVKYYLAITVIAISEYRPPRDVFIVHLDDTGTVVAIHIACICISRAIR